MAELDQGLILAAERYAAENNSHGILALLKEYRWWFDLAINHPSPEAEVTVTNKANRLRKALVANRAADWIEERRKL